MRAAADVYARRGRTKYLLGFHMFVIFNTAVWIRVNGSRSECAKPEVLAPNQKSMLDT
jgi:hypothetical protein